MVAIWLIFKDAKSVINYTAQSQNKSKLGWINCSLVICEYGKYKNCMILRLLDDKKANKTENMAEIGGGGVSEIQCLVYQQDNVNPSGICNNCIQLNIVFHVMIIHLGNMKI